MARFTSYMWLLPFIAAATGYFVVSRMSIVPEYPLPAISGLSLREALVKLSELQLAARVSRVQERDDCPDGTVVAQVPGAGTRVKPQQTVFLTISVEREKSTIPDLVGRSRAECEEILSALGIKTEVIFVSENSAADTCISQDPEAGSSFVSSVYIFIARAKNSAEIIPDFRGALLSDVEEKCLQRGVRCVVYRQDRGNVHGAFLTVVDQRPLPGTIVRISPELVLQVAVVAERP